MNENRNLVPKDEKKKNGKIGKAIAAGAVAFAGVGMCLAQSGALAYLTDYDHVTKDRKSTRLNSSH